MPRRNRIARRPQRGKIITMRMERTLASIVAMAATGQATNRQTRRAGGAR